MRAVHVLSILSFIRIAERMYVCSYILLLRFQQILLGVQKLTHYYRMFSAPIYITTSNRTCKRALFLSLLLLLVFTRAKSTRATGMNKQANKQPNQYLS